MISQATHRIMACLRGTLNRLRHPPAEEFGLEASLVNLVESRPESQSAHVVLSRTPWLSAGREGRQSPLVPAVRQGGS